MTEPPSADRRLGPRLLVLVAALACVVGALSARDLWAPDEPRYGQVAREMLASGDWLVPHVNGAPYAEKPPLYYWVAAALSAPGGRVTAITARLAAALLAAGAVWLTRPGRAAPLRRPRPGRVRRGRVREQRAGALERAARRARPPAHVLHPAVRGRGRWRGRRAAACRARCSPAWRGRGRSS